MIRETLEMCQIKAGKFEVPIRTQISSTENIPIKGQRVPLSQVLLNLVSNAIDEQSKSKEQLEKEGYKPVSDMGLMWIKEEK
jgi:signal transduction histidine kinase